MERWRRLAIVFIALGCYVALVHTSMSSTEVTWMRSRRAGDLAAVRFSIHRPFTLDVPAKWSMPERRNCPGFLKANYYIISWAWTACFVP